MSTKETWAKKLSMIFGKNNAVFCLAHGIEYCGWVHSVSEKTGFVTIVAESPTGPGFVCFNISDLVSLETDECLGS